MNIKQIIDAGHYPTDDKGRPLVYQRDGKIVTILATDAKEPYPITGMREGVVMCWKTTGWKTTDWNSAIPNVQKNTDLMPPKPKTEMITRWMLTGDNMDFIYTGKPAKIPHGYVLTEMKGERIIPWTDEPVPEKKFEPSAWVGSEI